MTHGSYARSTQESTEDSAACAQRGSPGRQGSSLGCSVLVLNRFYMAIRVVNVRRAMTLLYRGCAEVITIENSSYYNYDFEAWCEVSQIFALEKQPEEDYLRAVSFEIQVPRIVRLTRYDKLPKTTVRFNRKNLFARDDHRCQYCGQNRPSNQLSLDHVIPRSLGGKTTWENIVCSCLQCNSRKGGRTPSQAGMTLLTKPVKPNSNPAMSFPLDDPRYASWKTFVRDSSAIA
jgi:5-methylcytosine-specific restriction endonuclease McrA